MITLHSQCTFTITDRVGNTLVLVEKIKKRTGDDDKGHEAKVEIISTRYNTEPETCAVQSA